MFKPIRKTHPAIKIMNSSVIDLPAPSNLSIWWNFGSLLGMCLFAQILTGLFLSMHYTPHVDLAFSSVSHITQDVSYGWMLRNTHANMASWFFICLYLHIGRGMYYNSFLLVETWNIGVILLFLSIMTAFLGYVLPWGQMSFWGATVITNLLSAVPYVGLTLVEWLWGGFAVDNATLNRFFALHFIFPFIILALVIIHLLFLHQTGSNNPLGVDSNSDKILFHSYYTIKDSVGFIVVLMLVAYLCLFNPNLLTDPENFITANPMVTPVHIKPEWYFLWPYAILRSIPNKLGGVIAMVSGILILMILPFTATNNSKVMSFYPLNQLLFWLLTANMLLLTWIGGCPVEAPYETLGKFLTVSYFMFYILNPTLHYLWDYLIKP